MSKSTRQAPSDVPALTRRALLQRAGLTFAALAAADSVLPARAAAAPPEARAGTAALPKVPTPGPNTAVLRVAHAQLNPDGRQDVAALAINGSFPGPEIRVREGDLVRLQLENHLDDQPTSLHWHGLLLPAVMDGVPGVSGPPVEPGHVRIFEYPIRQSGTYWYHSHYGLQEQRGLAGPFVIEPRHEPGHYDHDAIVLLSDWLHSNPDEIVPRLRAEGAKKPGMDMKPTDGAPMRMGGGADLSDVKYDAFLLNGKGVQAPWTFAARAGARIRVRLINGAASSYLTVSADGLPLEVTHADGQPVRPLAVDQILMGMGETYDVIVRLPGSGAYTLHAVAQDGSGQAVGVLHTPDAKPVANIAMPKPGPRMLAYSALQASEDTTLPDGPVRELRIVLGGNMNAYTWTMNGELYPDAQPLPIRQGERVRVELVNDTAMWHPMHLHGHYFRLLATDGPFAPLKHTMNVAPKGSAAFEFTADNPGDWIFHCHNLYHFEAGMGRVFRYEV